MVSTRSALALGVCLCLPVAASAAPTGGLASLVGPGNFAVSAALAFGERDVRDGSDDEATTFGTLLRGEFGLMDGLDAYLIAGLSDVKLDKADFDGNRGGTFGGGLRYGLMHFEESATRLVLDLQAEYLSGSDDSNDLHVWEYHAATYIVKEFGAAGTVGYFYPYGGFRVSYAKYSGDGGVDDYESKDLVGVFAGADYFVNPNVYFTGEIHLFDEASISVGAGYRF